jgi:hypothetical protein
MQKQSTWLITKADNADAAHSKKVAALLDKHVANRGGSEIERARITGIIDRLVETLDQDVYRKLLIEKSTEELLSAGDGGLIRCWKPAQVKRVFKSRLKSYEESLDQVEEAIKERLGLEFLQPNEGLVAILFYSRGRAEDVRINRLGAIGGDISFGPIQDGDYFRVVKAKAGTYRWHSVTNRFFSTRYTAYLKRGELDFNVEAGKLNYVGAFLYESEGYSRYSIDVYDRASVMLSLLESRYPELMDSVELRNSLNSENRFIEFYMREKLAQQSEDDDA